MTKEKRSRYAEAGVDIDKGNKFVDLIKPIVAATHNKNVLGNIGGFNALYDLGFDDLALVSSTDGVGTKLAVANMVGRHDTVGIDLVGMCVNDLIVGGAKPLIFLDYFASGKLELDVAVDVVRGIAEGCQQAGCALVGGETAEMPGMYKTGEYDLAGFVVGLVNKKKAIDGFFIKPSDVIIGLPSNGLHSNGYSLVRKICFQELGLNVGDYIEEFGSTLGEELLRPTRIYVKPILSMLSSGFKIKGMAHITGGGFIDNIPRMLPSSCKAIVKTVNVPLLPIFDFIQKKGNVPQNEMFKTFNNGIGLVMVVDALDVSDIIDGLQERGECPVVIGTIALASDGDDRVVFV